MPLIYVRVNGDEYRVLVKDMSPRSTSSAVKTVRLLRALEAESRAKKMITRLEFAMERKLEVVKYEVR